MTAADPPEVRRPSALVRTWRFVVELWDVLRKPSVPAAQITVSRAVMRLADEMATETTPQRRVGVDL